MLFENQLIQKENDPWGDDDLKADICVGLGINPVMLEEKLHSIMTGTGRNIDQMFLYTSPASVSLWLKETALEAYKASSAHPVDEIAKGILRRIHKTMPEQTRLRIISLGSGEAHQEQRLIQALVEKGTIQNIKLHLVDSSYPLLLVGFDECHKVFFSYPSVRTVGVYQDFYTLPENKDLLRTLYKTNEVKLVTMVGGTFSNLEKEALFLRDVLGSLPVGILLLIDVSLPYAPATQAAEIKEKEPWLQGRAPWARIAEQRWAVPFREHHPQVKGLEDVKFVPVLDNRTCQIPGSYAIEMRAFIGQQQFTVQRIKRHDLTGLIETFKEENWSLVSSYPFYNERRAAILFQKDSA